MSASGQKRTSAGQEIRTILVAQLAVPIFWRLVWAMTRMTES